MLASSRLEALSCGVARKLPCVSVKLRPDQWSDRIRDRLVRGRVERGAPTLAYSRKEFSCIPVFPHYIQHILPVKVAFEILSREASLTHSTCGESSTASSSLSQSSITVTLTQDLVLEPSEEVGKELVDKERVKELEDGLVDKELKQECGGLTRMQKRAVMLVHREWPVPLPQVVAQLYWETGALPAGVREEYWNLNTSLLRVAME